MRHILITGASGLVGRFLIEELQKEKKEEISIYASSSDDEKLKKIYKHSNIIYMTNDSLYSIDQFNKIDTVVHCAFTRKNDSVEVARALNFTENLLKVVKNTPKCSFINVSTRSVYKEPDYGMLNYEDSIVAPSGYIGIAKYASELMTNLALFENHNYTNLRIASVNELKLSDNIIRPMNVFVERMLRNDDIDIIGGMQVMSYIDPRDVATAIKSIIFLNKKWKPIYNVGTGWMCTKTLYEIAERVIDIGVEKFHLKPVSIKVQNKKVEMSAGMSIDLISKDTGWNPIYNIDDMIVELYSMYISNNRGE